MITAVSIFSCTNDYDPGLIENLGMKEQPLRIITKVLTTKSPNFMQEFTRGSVIYNPQNQKSRFQKRKIKKNGKRFVDSLYSLIDLKTI